MQNFARIAGKKKEALCSEKRVSEKSFFAVWGEAELRLGRGSVQTQPFTQIHTSVKTVLISPFTKVRSKKNQKNLARGP